MLNTERPLTGHEAQAAVLHCDECEMGDELHAQWVSVGRVKLHVVCEACRKKDVPLEDRE